MLLGETPEETTEPEDGGGVLPGTAHHPGHHRGSQDLSIGQYKAYEFLGQAINLAVIDERIDIDHADDAPPRQTWLLDIFSHEPNYLFNYSAWPARVILSTTRSSTIDHLCFDTCRLGRLRDNFQLAEPELRDADMVGFDLSAIKASDAMGVLDLSPNGVNSEEACQLMRYAGMSDKVSSMGIYNCFARGRQPGTDRTAGAQMIWYFVDGFYNRKHDYPITDESDFMKIASSTSARTNTTSLSGRARSPDAGGWRFLYGGYSLRTPATRALCIRRLRRSHERHTARQMAADVREVIGLIPPQHKPQLGHRNGTLRLLTYFHKADSPVSVDRQITMQDIPG